MAKRLAELGALQDAVSNDEAAPSRLGLAGYIRGLFLDWSANPYNPLSRLTARGRLLGYFWDSGAIGLSMNFADQNYLVKDGTVKSKSFSDIVNFSRTTNATVTNSAGLITYAPHNLLTYSEQFDNAAWTKTRTTISANTTLAPDGTTTADTLIESIDLNSHFLRRTGFTSAQQTLSVYVKAKERSWINLGTFDSTFRYTWFDVSNGTVGTVSANHSNATITPVGNGWYRCSISAITTEIIITITTGDTVNSYQGDGTSGIYVWGAQLEVGASPTTYNSTTVKNLLGYSELFDNAAWTKSNSFVQTNLLTYSEDFTVAGWAKTTVTATANSIVAPNGYQTADTLLATGTNSTALQTFTASAVPYTFSIYLYRKTGTGNIDITVDGTTWVTKTITAGWTRVDTTLTPAAGSKTAGIRIATNGDEVYAWGAQLVQGLVAGDYRRTDAAALPVYYPNHNGVVCAEKLVENVGASTHVVNPATFTFSAAVTYTYSMYVKAGERTWCALQFATAPFGTATRAWYDLENIVTGTVANATATITDVGNGWRRISLTATSTVVGTSSTPIVTYASTGNGVTSYTGDGTSGIYIFGAQLSDSASLDPYVLNAGAAPTAAAYYGHRFDYDPVTLAPKGLLIEEQRSNLLLNSVIAGTNLATQNVTVTAVAHTLSFYGTGSITLSGTASATLNGTGAYPSRATLTFTPTAGTLTLTVSGTVQYAQLEIGSFATSFIPTAASQTTRAADVATIQGSNFYSWYNQNEGSVFVNVLNHGLNGSVSYTNINDGTTSNALAHYYNNVATQAAFAQTTGGAVQANIAVTSGTVLNNTLKAAGAYKVNDFALSANNSTVGVDISGVTSIYTQMNLGRNAVDTATSRMNGTIKQISYYPQRLSNDVLKGLTA